MQFVYVMINNTSDWEDIVIYLNEEEAIQSSKKYSNIRIEIFEVSLRGSRACLAHRGGGGGQGGQFAVALDPAAGVGAGTGGDHQSIAHQGPQVGT